MASSPNCVSISTPGSRHFVVRGEGITTGTQCAWHRESLRNRAPAGDLSSPCDGCPLPRPPRARGMPALDRALSPHFSFFRLATFPDRDWLEPIANPLGSKVLPCLRYKLSPYIRNGPTRVGAQGRTIASQMTQQLTERWDTSSSHFFLSFSAKSVPPNSNDDRHSQ